MSEDMGAKVGVTTLEPEQNLSLNWILLGVDRRGDGLILDADSGFFDLELLTELWAIDNSIECPVDLGAGLYLMTDIVITPDANGDPTFKGEFQPLATIADAIAKVTRERP